MKGFSVTALLVLIITVFVSIISVDSGLVPARLTEKAEDAVDSQSNPRQLFGSLPKSPADLAKKVGLHKFKEIVKAEVADFHHNKNNPVTPPPRGIGSVGLPPNVRGGGNTNAWNLPGIYTNPQPDRDLTKPNKGQGGLTTLINAE